MFTIELWDKDNLEWNGLMILGCMEGLSAVWSTFEDKKLLLKGEKLRLKKKVSSTECLYFY